MKILAKALVLFFCALPLFSQSPKPALKTTYIRAGHLFDSTSEKVRDNVVIVVEGERIKSVEAGSFAIPAGSTVIDLRNATVLPGLIDCHTHLTARADRYDPINHFRNTPFKAGFTAMKNAHVTLLAGFTTVRDVGSPPFAAVDLRNSINEGFISGPRVVASGPPLSITGGHGDLNGFSPETQVWMFPEQRDYRIADGVDQVRETVRAQVKYGVDVIKILATGGVLSQGDSPGAPQYTFEELKTAADEAHAAGRKIAAHAHGAEGIKRAILAGIDSIEHASLANDEDIQLAKEHGTYFVMDIYNDDYILGKAIEFGLPQENVDKERMVGRTTTRELREGVQGRCEDGVRHGCRRLPARR